MAMNNLEALKAQCKLICNTCYVDDDVLNLCLANAGINGEDTAQPNDPKIVSEAIVIIKGWVETNRSENGISTSVDVESIRKNIIFWCGKADLDASGYIDDLVVIDNGSNMW